MLKSLMTSLSLNRGSGARLLDVALGIKVAAAGGDCGCPPVQYYCRSNPACGVYGELYQRPLIDCANNDDESWCKYSSGSATGICC